MRTRKLGSHGPHITTVGLGAWAIGGPWKMGWGPVDDEESIKAIRHAVDRGVNWVDTAAVYGLGHSEEITGRALEPYNTGEDVYVFTKCGLNWFDTDDGQPSNNLRPDSIRFECEQSLKRLCLERIDLYQFHWPDEATGTQVEDSWGTMGELIDEGKVRWGGVSNFDVELLERCNRIRHVDSLQPPLSLINRSPRNDVIAWCDDNGTGVIVYSPMHSGLLTGKYTRASISELDDGDWRKRDRDFNEPRLSRNLELVARLEAIATQLGTTLPVLVVAWTIAVEGVTAAIVGARSPEQVDGWLPAGDLRLSDDALGAIEDAVAASGAGEG
ncbi:MAG: aldo/keto reductase [Actinobacteria bacterium]|nr:aldo/keto reductase [Actinomycetota bacterium]